MLHAVDPHEMDASVDHGVRCFGLLQCLCIVLMDFSGNFAQLVDISNERWIRLLSHLSGKRQITRPVRR